MIDEQSGGLMTVQALFEKALIELAEATQQSVMTSKRASEARRDESDARNRLNKAQAEIDKLIAEMKRVAPRDSDWNRPKGVSI